MKFFKDEGVKMGLDIGKRFIKGLCLSKAEQGFSVDSYFIYERKETENAQKAAAELDNFLQEMVTQCDLAGAKVTASLSYDQFTSFELNVPQMPNSDLEQIIENKLTEQVSYPLSEASFAYLQVNQGQQEKGNAGLYKVYSSNKNGILDITKTLSNAKLEVVHLEPEPLSIAAALSCNELIDTESTHLVLDIGESQITGFLIHKEKVLNVNHLSQNMHGIQQTLMDKLDLSAEEAEMEKRNFSFDSGYAGNEIVQSLFDDFYCSVFDEIKRIAKLYSLQLQNQNIDSILLTGGGSGCGLIEEALESYCHLPCFKVNPFRNIDHSSPEINTEYFNANKHLMTTALGLALRGVA